MGRDPAVAIGPGDERQTLLALLRHTRSEIEDCRPGAGVLELGAIVIAARIRDEPTKAWRIEPLRVEPIANRHAVELHHLGVVGAGRGGDRERSAAMTVAPGDPFRDFRFESAELAKILAACACVQVETFVPAAAKENSFLRIAADGFLRD